MNFKKFVLPLCVVLAAGSAFASGVTSKHAANGVACTVCHKDGIGKVPSAQTCRTCHNQEFVIKATESLNFIARLKDPKSGKEITHTARVNPHDSYHFGREQDCTDCHKEHRASTNTCATCHDIKAWKMGVPR